MIIKIKTTKKLTRKKVEEVAYNNNGSVWMGEVNEKNTMYIRFQREHNIERFVKQLNEEV